MQFQTGTKCPFEMPTGLKGIERVGWEHFVQIWLDKQVDAAARAAGRAPNIFRGPAVRTALNRPGAGANADNTCPICFDKLDRDIVVIDDGTILGRPVVCGHKFHKGCIQRWMDGKAAPTCPVCRGSIRPTGIINRHPQGAGL